MDFKEAAAWVLCGGLVLAVLAIASAAASNNDAPTESTRREAAADDVPMGNEGCLVGTIILGFLLFVAYMWIANNH